jgi:cyanophycinase-like exopeptidase
MRALVLLLAAFLAAGGAHGQSHHPGPVVLLGETAAVSAVPELAGAPQSSILLVAGSEASPHPLDARAWGGDERTEIVRLLPASEAARDRALLARVRAAERIAFGPGSAKEWLDALLERERPSALTSAVHEAWNGGAMIVGRGDSAALLSAGFVVHGPEELGWDERNPRDPGGARAASGLSYQPWALLDTEGRSSGSLRRLLRSVCHARIELALYLPSSAALAIDVTEARFTVRGAGVVTILDARRARRLRGSVQDVRLARLPTGAVWNVAERRVALEPEDPGARAPETADAPVLHVEELFHSAELCALPSLPPSAESRWWRDDGERRLELRFDASSRWGRIGRPEDRQPSAYWVDGLACDLAAADL